MIINTTAQLLAVCFILGWIAGVLTALAFYVLVLDK